MYRQVCRFLNETVSHEEQAKKLGITVVLYEKLVAVRKLYSDKIDEGRLALAVSVKLWKSYMRFRNDDFLRICEVFFFNEFDIISIMTNFRNDHVRLLTTFKVMVPTCHIRRMLYIYLMKK